MDRTQLEATFDRQAGAYDQQWARLAPLQEALHLLLASVFADLPTDARLLCVGAGTGAEIERLAARFPAWTFVAVEPSAQMVELGRAKAQERGYAARCRFHHGYLESLPDGDPFDGATSLLVSQFLLDAGERTGFFRAIAERLKPRGLLASADLAGELRSPGGGQLLALWMRTMAGAAVPAQRAEQMRQAYARDVAILPPGEVAAVIGAAGFAAPVAFFQASLLHAWYAERRAS